MERFKLDAQALAEKLDLPGEALGALLVTAVGDGCVRIENHRGIEQFSSEYIRLSSTRGSLSITGEGLRIRALSRDALAIEGRLGSMEWEK